ncbi:hypothetical protein HDU85_007802 [Gaertneriomyces sp. JEL0708]|nr:hypothetical protein HDU85_007802 [Gaertneriomyces sp. JEL0708]
MSNSRIPATASSIGSSHGGRATTGMSALERAQAYLRGDRAVTTPSTLGSTSRQSNTPSPKEDLSDENSSDNELRTYLKNLAKRKLQGTPPGSPANPLNRTTHSAGTMKSNLGGESSYLKRPQTTPAQSHAQGGASGRLSGDAAEISATTVLGRTDRLKGVQERLMTRAPPQHTDDLFDDDDEESSLGSDFESFLQKKVRAPQRRTPSSVAFGRLSTEASEIGNTDAFSDIEDADEADVEMNASSSSRSSAARISNTKIRSEAIPRAPASLPVSQSRDSLSSISRASKVASPRGSIMSRSSISRVSKRASSDAGSNSSLSVSVPVEPHSTQNLGDLESENMDGYSADFQDEASDAKEPTSEPITEEISEHISTIPEAVMDAARSDNGGDDSLPDVYSRDDLSTPPLEPDSDIAMEKSTRSLPGTADRTGIHQDSGYGVSFDAADGARTSEHQLLHPPDVRQGKRKVVDTDPDLSTKAGLVPETTSTARNLFPEATRGENSTPPAVNLNNLETPTPRHQSTPMVKTSDHRPSEPKLPHSDLPSSAQAPRSPESRTEETFPERPQGASSHGTVPPQFTFPYPYAYPNASPAPGHPAYGPFPLPMYPYFPPYPMPAWPAPPVGESGYSDHHYRHRCHNRRRRHSCNCCHHHGKHTRRNCELDGSRSATPAMADEVRNVPKYHADARVKERQAAVPTTSNRQKAEGSASTRPKTPISIIKSEYADIDALRTIMAKHLQLIEEFVATNIRITESERRILEYKPHITLDDTRRYLDQHRKPPMTMNEALQLVDYEERLYG